MDLSENLSYGLQVNDMIPDIEAEGKNWKFYGIQSKNRKEWFLSYISGFFQGATSVGMYDSLGPDAVSFIIN